MFKLTLFRGLDYYTSLIFEVVVPKEKGKQSIGSIAGGGRYDKLCGVGCVGFSLGIDRLLSVLDQNTFKSNSLDVWVIQVGDNMTQELETKLFSKRQQIVKKFRQFNIRAGTELRRTTGLGNQMKLALKMSIPFVIFIGEKELISDKLSIKIMHSREQLDMLSFSEIMYLINTNGTSQQTQSDSKIKII